MKFIKLTTSSNKKIRINFEFVETYETIDGSTGMKKYIGFTGS